MVERASPGDLLRRASALFDAPGSSLSQQAQAAWRAGFLGGAAWMREILGQLRGAPLAPIPRNYHLLGLAKYSAACIAAAMPVVLALWWHSPLLLLFAPLAFYAMEAQMVFLFPLALDGQAPLWRTSRAWTVRAGGTLRVMSVVVPLAVTMLCGGFLGQGFLRSWCLGCLAICVWYEDLRITASVGPAQAPSRRANVWLEIGASGPLHVREEIIGGLGLRHAVRLLYASDLHLGALGSRRVAEQVIEAARDSRPDLIILGGDLVDRRGALPQLSECVRHLVALAPLWAIAGNHDLAVGVALVREAVEAGGGAWLDQTAVMWPREKGPRLRLDGRPRADHDGSGVRILCAHDPAVYDHAIQAGYRLVLAGHLHGGQWVLGEWKGRLYPAAWVYPWNGRRFERNGTTLLVSRGAADTLPLRWNCPREVLLCHLVPAVGK